MKYIGLEIPLRVRFMEKKLHAKCSQSSCPILLLHSAPDVMIEHRNPISCGQTRACLICGPPGDCLLELPTQLGLRHMLLPLGCASDVIVRYQQ